MSKQLPTSCRTERHPAKGSTEARQRTMTRTAKEPKEVTCAVARVGMRRMHMISLLLCALDALGSSSFFFVWAIAVARCLISLTLHCGLAVMTRLPTMTSRTPATAFCSCLQMSSSRPSCAQAFLTFPGKGVPT